VIAAWQRATHLILSALEDELSDLGLSAGETNTLACFAGARERTVGELVAATAQRPSTLTGILDRLEKRDLLERRPNPADRRSTHIVLTPKGRAQAKRVETAFDRLQRRIAAALPGGEADVGRVVDAVERALAP
jgi:DNA-binding MarR family transcriptional regulator